MAVGDIYFGPSSEPFVQSTMVVSGGLGFRV